MHHAIQDPVLQREECAFLYGERVFKVREAGGATGGGGATRWETLRYSRGHSSAKDFQEISLSVIRLTLP